MADAWGVSWGVSWGRSWGFTPAVTQNPNLTGGAGTGGHRAPYPVGDSRPKPFDAWDVIADRQRRDDGLSLLALEAMKTAAVMAEIQLLKQERINARRMEIAADEEDIEALLMCLTI